MPRAAVETARGHIYDFPKYYDLVYGSDWKAEFDFLRACFERFAARRVKRLFEPACGTGRLMVKLARAGFDVAGNDLNPQAIAFCNARLERHGFHPTALVGDMADFRLPRPVDAAFNMINSFRHLPDERSAESHLKCMARAVAPGGLYVLALHLTPTVGDRVNREEWAARRGNLAVISSMWSDWIDLTKRQEHVGMSFDVHTPTKRFRIEDDMTYRTYTAPQMRSLLRRAPEFEIAATFDFTYDLAEPIEIDARTEDVVFVLRRLRGG